MFASYSNSFWGNDFCSMGFYNTKALSDPNRWDINSRSWRFQTCNQVILIYIIISNIYIYI